jgi:hypothetical protein
VADIPVIAEKFVPAVGGSMRFASAGRSIHESPKRRKAQARRLDATPANLGL